MGAPTVRFPAVAGQFYPATASVLRDEVQGHIRESGVTPAPERVAAIVAPHAGYVYSGPSAGYAYARVRGKRPSRAILLGVSHRYRIDTAAVYPAGAFDTPLGPMGVDEQFAARLTRHGAAALTEPHAMEHSLEVQLPFLHEAVGAVPIVPVLFGAPPSERHIRFGEALASLAAPEDLVIASTDLSHYLSEREANAIDELTIRAVVAGNFDDFVRGVCGERYSLCGAAAVLTVMAYAAARGASHANLLDYRTSAKTSGDFGHVVGYASIAFEYPEPPAQE